MNYQKIYDRLIIKRRKNILVKKHRTYIERHHIIPRCMNGSNESNNIIYLTPREHYIAHLLLYKIYGNTKYEYSLLKAILCMCEAKQKDRKIFSKSKIYERIRSKYYSSEFCKENGRKGYIGYIKDKTQDEILEIRKRASITWKRWFNNLKPEVRHKISCRCKTLFTGRKHTELSKEKMRSSSKNIIRTGSNNPISGKIWITNRETKINKLIDNTENIPIGWSKGRYMNYTSEQLQKMSKCSSNFSKGTIGIYNPLTGEKRRIKNNIDIPDGFERGFGKNKKNKS